MSKRFKLFRWEIEMSMGTCYWGNEPTPVRSSWGFEFKIDFNNRDKLQYNYDLTKVLTEEMVGCWVCLGPLNKSVLDYDIDLQILHARIKEKGLTGTFMRYAEHGVHLH